MTSPKVDSSIIQEPSGDERSWQEYSHSLRHTIAQKSRFHHIWNGPLSTRFVPSDCSIIPEVDQRHLAPTLQTRMASSLVKAVPCSSNSPIIGGKPSRTVDLEHLYVGTWMGGHIAGCMHVASAAAFQGLSSRQMGFTTSQPSADIPSLPSHELIRGPLSTASKDTPVSPQLSIFSLI